MQAWDRHRHRILQLSPNPGVFFPLLNGNWSGHWVIGWLPPQWQSLPIGDKAAQKSVCRPQLTIFSVDKLLESETLWETEWNVISDTGLHFPPGLRKPGREKDSIVFACLFIQEFLLVYPGKMSIIYSLESFALFPCHATCNDIIINPSFYWLWLTISSDTDTIPFHFIPQTIFLRKIYTNH